MKHDLHNPRRCRIGFGDECRCRGAVVGRCARCGLDVSHHRECDPTAEQYAVHHLLERLSTSVFYVGLRRDDVVTTCRRIALAVGLDEAGPAIWRMHATTWRREAFTKTLLAAGPSTRACGYSADLILVEQGLVDEGLWQDVAADFVVRLRQGSPSPVFLRGR